MPLFTIRYGIDAPHVVRNLFLMGILFPIIHFSIALIFSRCGCPGIAQWFEAGALFAPLTLFSVAFYMLYSSFVRKFEVRDQIVHDLGLTGTEQVLDVGCGRGALLIGIAKKLSTGTAIGSDIWDKKDLSGNNSATTYENAHYENVTEKVKIVTADATNLPFQDASYDAVVSMTTLHNIPTQKGREQALREMVRVLKKGGKLCIFDIFRTAEYLAVLQTLPLGEIKTSSPFYLWCVPGRIISVRK